MDRKLTVSDSLKLLTNNDVPIPKAMDVASKVFQEYNTPSLLARLDNGKLQMLGIKDKVLRKLVLAAIRKAGYLGSIPKPRSGHDTSLARPVSSKPTTITPKKRKHDDDLNAFLPEAPQDESAAYGSMDFNDVLDEEVLRMKSAVVNRAPLMTAWATIVAERLGFDREEALSIGSVYTEMNAVAKGVSLGIIDQSRKEVNSISGGQQPYVVLMGRRIPLYQTQSSKWRALVSGSPANPSNAFLYISRAFRQTTPYVVGALRLLASSYPPEELNKVGFSLYADFQPKVDGWGKRGKVRCEHILSLRKEAGVATEDAQFSDNHEPSGKNSLKRAQTSSSKECNTTLDQHLELGGLA